ncbi:hypothetical protein MTBPR1_170003 [Candidatus Terasakiella magnetica]|uniref:Flagellin N-terminal domain-containing protein n=1 Tax=Candidatus Terasakiella magnetica TaxID=1867952 RepID=A0A1C3RFJ1_9PROT|nr:hypothetical protein [Candidatus Terasakiella magnetica]SCA56057.1 hypothetical protein MTBPR1_170003 [Candidatus Terasakiella magnetica]
MVDSISLINSALSTSVGSTRRATELREDSANNLASGTRVNEVRDDPSDYLRAKALIDAVADLGSQKGTIELEQSQIEVGNVALGTIEDLGRQLQGLANAAKTAETLVEREALSEQFNNVRNQIDQVVKDSSFDGEASLTDVSSDLLGIGDASIDYNDFATLTDINAAINSINTAIDDVRTRQSNFGSELAALDVEEEFTTNLANSFQEGIDELVNADLSEEAAVTLAAQVRTDLSFQGQAILAQSESLLLGLFSS